MLTGWKTLLFNGGVIVGTALLQWAAGIDWLSLVGPEWSMVIVAGVNFALRFFTTTPVGGK